MGTKGFQRFYGYYMPKFHFPSVYSMLQPAKPSFWLVMVNNEITFEFFWGYVRMSRVLCSTSIFPFLVLYWLYRLLRVHYLKEECNYWEGTEAKSEFSMIKAEGPLPKYSLWRMKEKITRTLFTWGSIIQGGCHFDMIRPILEIMRQHISQQ